MTDKVPAHASRIRLLLNQDVPYRPSAAEKAALIAACPNLEIVEAHGTTAPVDLSEVDILVTDQGIPPNLECCPRLKWIQLVSAGANQIMNHPIATSPIMVSTASGLHGVPIAQFVTGALLILVHQFPQLAAIQATRKWPKERWQFRGSLLRGATVGIVGYGSIGRECARQLHALGMRVLALDPGAKRDEGYNVWSGTGDREGTLPERWFTPAQVGEMLPLCDAVVVAVPLTKSTVGMIGPKELANAKPGIRFIIISRGGIVDEPALAAALKDGRVAGAAIDCFVEEPPPPDHPFYDAPNTILTPHMAGAFEGFWPAMMTLLAENLRRFAGNQPLLNLANKKLGY